VGEWSCRTKAGVLGTVNQEKQIKTLHPSQKGKNDVVMGAGKTTRPSKIRKQRSRSNNQLSQSWTQSGSKEKALSFNLYYDPQRRERKQTDEERDRQ